MKKLLICTLCALAVTACTSKLKKENEELRQEIAERRTALSERMQTELDEARRQLQHTDSLLNIARQEHDAQHEKVMSHATALNDQSPEVLLLNSLRQRRDSLQVEFERQAQKVKFYMSKNAK